MITMVAALYVIVPALLALASVIIAYAAPLTFAEHEPAEAPETFPVTLSTARVLWARAAYQARFGTSSEAHALRTLALVTATIVLTRMGRPADEASAIASILTGGVS